MDASRCIQNVVLAAIVFCLYASQMEQQVGQGVGHKAFMPYCFYLFKHLRVFFNIFWRAVYPEWNCKLVACQIVINLGRMVAAYNASVAFKTFFAVVGHIDNHRFFVGKAFHYLVYYRIVVQDCIVVVCQHIAALLRQLWAFLLIICRSEVLLTFRITSVVRHVAADEMEYNQVVFFVFCLQLVVVVGKQSVIECV